MVEARYQGNPQIHRGDGRLRNCVVRTRFGAPQPVVGEYSLAGLSGRGSIAFGSDAASIIWEMEFNTSSAELAFFEAAVRVHQLDPKRNTLVSETGESWSYVELRNYERLSMDRVMSGSEPFGPEYHVRARITFRWMQPG